MSGVERYLLWFLTSAAAAAAVAWIAFQLQQEQIAPAVLFPLLVGGALGGILAAIRRATLVPGARVAVVAAVAWGLLVVVGQDYIGHRHRLDLYRQQMARQATSAALVAPELERLQPDFGSYLTGLVRREPLWWTLDAVLTSAVAAIVTAWSVRRQDAANGARQTEQATREPG